MDFRPKIILLIGAPNYKGNNYYITIQEVKVMGNSNSNRNINGPLRL